MSTIPGLAPLTIAGVSTTDGRGVVPQALMLAPLICQIPRWAPEPSVGSPPHVVELFGISNGTVTLLDTLVVGPPPPPIRNFYNLTISLAYMRSAPSRVVQLYYTVTTEGGSNSMLPTIPVTFDLDPPRRLLPTDVLQFVVPPVPALDNAYLQNNPRVAFNLPVYNIAAPGDRVELFLSNQANPAPNLPAAGGALVNFATSPWTVSLDAAAFRALSNGPAYVFYKIFDATGNFSTRSIGLPFNVNLGTVVPTPSITLPAPRVQHTLTNGYLNCTSVPSVMAGVIWLISPINAIQVGDELRCVWQGYNENNWETQNPNVVFQRSLLWTQQNVTTGATVVVDSFDTTLFPLRRFTSATFTYEVWRNGVRVGVSQPGRVRVDLTYSTGCYCTPRGIVCN